MNKIKFLTTHSKIIRKIFGILILTSAGFIASDVSAKSIFSSNDKVESATNEVGGLRNGLAQPYKAAEIVGIESWLNSQPLKISDLKGKVVLIDFWTYSCINCVRTLPYVTKWDQTYRDKGLVIIGVHAPEFEFEKNAQNVSRALIAHNIKYPVALDNHLDTWTAFKNRYWPAHYLIDKNGNVVYTHFGEGNYDVTENNIRHLLGLNDEVAKQEKKVSFDYEQTPETYLGYERAENFFSAQNDKVEKVVKYSFPQSLPQDEWALSGKWKVEKERIISQEKNAKLRLNFKSKKVFLVMGNSTSSAIKVEVMLNGKKVKNSPITVDKHLLFELVNQEESKNGLLELTASNSGLEAYAFTFGG